MSDDKVLEALAAMAKALDALTDRVTKVVERAERYAYDLEQFSERFEEVVEQMENERRLDWNSDIN